MRKVLLLLIFCYLTPTPPEVIADTYLWIDKNGLYHATTKTPPIGAKILQHFDANYEKDEIPIYFPNRNPNEKSDSGRSKYLYKMKEPVIYGSITDKSEAYRFLWRGTFNKPVCVRININYDTPSTLTLKATNGSGGYIPGELIRDETITLSNEQRDIFLDKIENCGFWTLDSPERHGLDGSLWLIEGAKKNKYHIDSAWSPKPSECIREIGALMMKLANYTEAWLY